MSGTYNATIRRVVVSAWIGNSIEYYDFLLYGLASALVFGPLFFPGASPLTATLSSFASFGVGFISRPLGALFFGNRGDTLGRKNTLLITLGGDGRGHVSHRLPAFLRQYWRAGACFTGYSAFSTGIYGWRRMGRRHVDGRGICCWKAPGAVKRAIANRRTHGTIIGDRRIYSRDPITAGGVVIVGMAYSFSAQCAFGVAWIIYASSSG